MEKERDIVLPPIDATPEEVAQALFGRKSEAKPAQDDPRKKEEGDGQT